MFFQTIDFGIFFVIVFFVYWSVYRWQNLRNYILLGASYVFFGYWNWLFPLLLLLSSVFTLFAGNLIKASESKESGKKILIGAIAVNLLILSFFKYYGYLTGDWGEKSDGSLNSTVFVEQYIVLPFGVLFFTLQSISYLFDVYRGKLPEKVTPLDLFLLMAYFPKLLAGPLVRAQQFFKELNSTADKEGIDFVRAISLILIGFFKKFVLANYIALQLVDPVYNDPGVYASFDILMAIFAYSLQLYWNLSAYSDLAIGISLLLGIKLPQNFNQPFRARSLREFWHSWFITFYAWLKDYVYFPVRGAISGYRKKIISLLVVCIVGSLWYGTGLNSIVLGLLGAGGLLVEQWLMQRWKRKKVSTRMKIFLTSSVVIYISFLLIFLRSENLTGSFELLIALFKFTKADLILTPLTLSLIIWGFASHFMPKEWGSTIVNFFQRLHPLTQAVIIGCAILLISTFGFPIEPTIKYFQY